MIRRESENSCKLKENDVVDRYRIVKLLGKGASGEVFLVEEGEKQFAMKVIAFPDKRNSKMYSRLKREVEIMRNLQHERIVRLYRVLKGEGYIYLICEYVSGGDLFDKIAAQDKLPEDVARRYFRQMVEGMIYCHEKGVSHRDIKPENIMITAGDDVKIADFGLSRVKTPSLQIFDTICGTLNYIAPELIAHMKYDSQCDVWSMGITLYVMLSGRFPYDSEYSDEDTARMILDNQFAFPESIANPQAKDIIRLMLDKDPNSRLTMKEVADHYWLR